ncbi:MAG TPA: peptidylprolyl isomerase [Vicinamibacterales bacterium]|nr:peptidylprolyl isomerase [Vicinamibacterales bacterium]
MIAKVLVMTTALFSTWLAQGPAQKPAPRAAPAALPVLFENPYAIEELRNKQAVIETSAGTIVIDLLPDRAPNHVGLFVKTAREGGYDGTIFHRVVRQGIIQGGDPLSKDPAAKDRYGTGGLNLLKAEPNPEKHTRGAVSAVLASNRPDSAGTQFFICIIDQPSLDGQYTVFARVAEGMLVAQKISEAPADEKGAPLARFEMKRVTIRDKPAPTAEPFSTETVADLARYRAVLETSMGDITIEFTPEKAPEHVRNFLRLASAGVYDGTSWHRVVKGFVIQTGHLPTRREALTETQQKHVRDLKAEFNDQPHDLGTVSMARLAEPDTASTSFFIVTARAQMLDNKYTAFGRVVDGIEVVKKVEAVPVNGETPIERVELKQVRVEKR